MEHNLTAIVATRLEAARETCLGLPEQAAQQQFILDTCVEVAQSYSGIASDNLLDIIKHYITVEAVPLDDLIQFLKANDGLDLQTRKREVTDDFDCTFGTTTNKILAQYELPEKISLERFLHSGRYHPSPVGTVNMVLNSLQKYNIRYEDYVFIDVGSGMGRNLLLAASYPFKKITGIEQSAYLHEIAKENIDKYLQGKESDIFDLQCEDALNYTFPSENLVLYFWRPFSDEIAEAFIDKLTTFAANASIRVVLIFLGVVYPVVETSGYFHLLDQFSTPDLSFSEEEYFTVTLYSNN